VVIIINGRPLIRNSLKNILYPNLSATAIATRRATEKRWKQGNKLF